MPTIAWFCGIVNLDLPNGPFGRAMSSGENCATMQ